MSRVVSVGTLGDAASDEETTDATLAVVNALLPSIEAMAAVVGGWSPVLNALCTLTMNLHIEQLGLNKSRKIFEMMLRDLPDAALAQKVTGADGMSNPTGGRA